MRILRKLSAFMPKARSPVPASSAPITLHCTRRMEADSSQVRVHYRPLRVVGRMGTPKPPMLYSSWVVGSGGNAGSFKTVFLLLPATSGNTNWLAEFSGAW